jgi:uncharacterized membrane protein YedE/YeeE
MSVISAGLFGLLFGIGLMVSGMTDPGRILAFLDVAGDWDPALALVMVGAIAIAMPAFARARSCPVSWFGETISLPERRPVDRRLVTGATLFGVGWGLAGMCPGPAVVLAGAGHGAAAMFVAALLAGNWLARRC